MTKSGSADVTSDHPVQPRRPAAREFSPKLVRSAAAPMLVLLAALLASCAQTPPPEVVSFSSQVQPLLTEHCVSCHSDGGGIPAGLSLASSVAYENLVGVSSIQSAGLMRVKSGDPEGSYLLHKVEGTQAAVGGSGQRMPPPPAATLTNDDVALFRQWISQGAQDN